MKAVYANASRKRITVTVTRTTTEAVPVLPSPMLGSHVVPANPQSTLNVGAGTTYHAATVGQTVQSAGAVTTNSATVGRSPYVAPAAPYLPSSPYVARAPVNQLRTEQAVMAPTVTDTVMQTRQTESTTAYVPESSTTVHRAYAHRRVHGRSGNIHVSRAIKHSVAFAVKLPGRLRL